MRKLMMAGALAVAALVARDVRADEAAKERREAWDATKAEAKQESREAQAEVKQESREARDRMNERSAQMQGGAQAGEKRHPVFDGKDNFEVKGKIQKVSMSSITVARDELPAATLSVSKGTKIQLDGENASMKQLRAGQEVKASFNLQGSKAEAVEIEAQKAEK